MPSEDECDDIVQQFIVPQPFLGICGSHVGFDEQTHELQRLSASVEAPNSIAYILPIFDTNRSSFFHAFFKYFVSFDHHEPHSRIEVASELCWHLLQPRISSHHYSRNDEGLIPDRRLQQSLEGRCQFILFLTALLELTKVVRKATPPDEVKGTSTEPTGDVDYDVLAPNFGAGLLRIVDQLFDSSDKLYDWSADSEPLRTLY